MRGFSVAVCMTLTAFATPATAAGCEKPIRVGWEAWSPFQIPAEGEPKGIDPDILRAIEKVSGCDIEFHETPWKRNLRALETGKLDVALAASITEERDKYAKWTISYLPYSSILWTGSDDNVNYGSLEDYLDSGNNLGIIRGFSYGETTDAILENAAYSDQIQENKSAKLNLRMIAADRIDGTLGNQFTMGYFAKREGLFDAVRATDVVVQSEPIYFMFSEKSTSDATIEKFDEAIRTLKADGTIQKIVDKYTN